MVKIGQKNLLKVAKIVEFGVYVDGGEEYGEILLPKRYVPANCQIGDELELFIYLDSEDRIIATTDQPLIEVGQLAHLEVVATSQYGAFLNWGLPKDLLVPFKEQRIPMQKGKSYTVYAFLDVTGRINASSKLSRFLKEYDTEGYFSEKQLVDLHICGLSDMGFRAVINDKYLGLIHQVDVLQPLKIGTQMPGYIKKIREDGKIDLVLQASGRKARESLADEVLEYIKANGGRINLSDRSSPEEIYNIFKVSKNNYKKALSRLYKERLILIEKDEIKLV